MAAEIETAPRQAAPAVQPVRGPFVKLPPHPRSVDSAEDLIAMLGSFTRPRAVDLFCGAGGLSLGLAEAGFDVILGVDNDPDELATHRAYNPGLSARLDLGDPEVLEGLSGLIKSLDIQLIAGGPPCQPFSSAARSALRDLVRRGLRPPLDRRRDLWQSFLQIVASVRPPAVLIENVPEMALDRDMWILRTLVDELEAIGYAVNVRVVPTSDYGVPQMRHRLILVALAGGHGFRWPPPTATVPLRSAIGDLPHVVGGWRPNNGDDPDDPVASGWATYVGEPVTEFQRRMRRDVPAAHRDRIYDHITRPVRADDKLAFEQMDSKTRYFHLDEGLRRYRNDAFHDKYNRLDWDELSRTITAHIAKDGYWYIHPSDDRTLTVREAARIQTFGDHIRFNGAPSVAFRQIGNAVPVLLAEHLGKAILSALDEPVHAVRSSHVTAQRLARWFRSLDQLTVPWLRAENRWQALISELLWSRLARERVREAWLATQPFRRPTDLLEESSVRALQRYARLLGREDRVEAVLAAAEWFTQHPEGLADGAPTEAFAGAPGVSSSLAEFVVRVRPGTGEDRQEPVLPIYGVLRVASRYTGEDVERRNRNSDGRLAVANMVGGEADSHHAHLGLFELANSLCGYTRVPLCANCPLHFDCEYARTRGYQRVLPLTTPAD